MRRTQPKLNSTSCTYVALGDSTPTGYGVEGRSYVNYYAGYVEADLGIKVIVRNWAVNGQATSALLEALRTNQQIRDDITQANILTLWTGWNDIIPRIGLASSQGSFPAACATDDGIDMECIREAIASLKNNIDAILADILSLRRTSDTLICVAEVANPVVRDWKERGLFEQLQGPAFEEWCDHIVQTADRHNIAVVHSYRLLNGSDGDRPVATEYMQSDGLHFNDKGHKLIAELHRRLGYGPLVR